MIWEGSEIVFFFFFQIHHQAAFEITSNLQNEELSP